MKNHWLPIAAAAFIAVFPGARADTNPPRTQGEYCTMAKDLTKFQSLAQDESNMTAFENDGGLFNGGVCWWHSRLQRAALYLTIFRPELKPDFKTTRKALDALMTSDHVVVIPGYRNWREVSHDWQYYIQKKLNEAQAIDGFLNQAWIEGLQGASHEGAAKLSRRMDDLYLHVHELREIVYEKLQLPGIPAHAWLVAGMAPTNDGYELTVLDSNFLQPQHYSYSRGMTSFEYPRAGSFVPYLRNDDELHDIQVEMVRYCNPRLAYERWAPAVRRAYADADPEFKLLMERNLTRAREEGKFVPNLREATITEDDRKPENWVKLFL